MLRCVKRAGRRRKFGEPSGTRRLTPTHQVACRPSDCSAGRGCRGSAVSPVVKSDTLDIFVWFSFLWTVFSTVKKCEHVVTHRNLAISGGVDVCSRLLDENVFTPLSEFLRKVFLFLPRLTHRLRCSSPLLLRAFRRRELWRRSWPMRR